MYFKYSNNSISACSSNFI